MEQDRDPRIAEVCSHLARACRAVRFYPPDHPVSVQGVSTLFHSLEVVLADRSSLHLDVTETSLSFEETPVYVTENMQDNVAFFLYRDGIRSLVFYPGIQRAETMALVSCLAHARDLDKSDSDLVTVLWEQDFPHIYYAVVDPLLAEEDTEGIELSDLRDGVRTALRHGLRGASTPIDHGEEEALETIIRTTEQATDDGNVLPSEEVTTLERDLAAEPDMLMQFLLVLGEMLAAARSDKETQDVGRAISGVLCSFMDWGEFGSLAEAIEMLREFALAAPSKPEAFAPVVNPLYSPDRLRKTVSGLDGSYADRRGDVERVLQLLGPRAKPPLLSILVEADGQAARKTLLNVLTTGPGLRLEHIAPYARDSRWYVVRNMVLLAGALGAESALPLLGEALAHPDERVRREVVRALAGVGTPAAAVLVARALNDPTSSVRTPAARAYASLGSPGGRGPLLRHISSKEFLARPEPEVEAFLDALAVAAGDESVQVLNDLWEGRSLLRSRPLHVRLAALRTLGKVQSAQARSSLKRASHAGDEQIRRQAVRSLAEIEQRMAPA